MPFTGWVTVILQTALIPFSVSAVMFAVPLEIAVILPEASTVATAGLLVVKVASLFVASAGEI